MTRAIVGFLMGSLTLSPIITVAASAETSNIGCDLVTDSSGYHDLAVAVSKDNGSSWSAEKTIRFEDYDVSDGIKIAGHGNSLWGLSWSPSDLSDSNFRVKVRLAARESTAVDDLAIDHISVKVFSTPGVAPGGTIRYVNDVLAPNPLVLMETDASSTPTRINVWGPSGLVSTGGTTTSSRLYPLTDHLGSIRFLTDGNGNIVQGYTYTPYGSATSTMPSSATTSPYLFAGEQYDPETELVYLRARYYDPTTGRFISRDPVRGTLDNPITQNPYIYAADNPTMYTDPSGEFIPLLVIGGLAIAYWLTDPIIGSPCGDVNPTPAQIAQVNNLGLLVFFGQLLGGPEYLAGKAVTSASLKNLIKDLYKGFGSPRQIGSGSTADAIRNELLTGVPTEGIFHSQKGTEYISALNNWLNANPNAASTDIDVANALIKDLVDALAGK